MSSCIDRIVLCRHTIAKPCNSSIPNFITFHLISVDAPPILFLFFQLIFHIFTFLSRMIPLFSFVILPRRNKAITRSVLHLNGGQITRVFLELPKQKKSYLTFWSFNNDILQFASQYTSCYLVVHSWFNCECFASSKMLEQTFVHETNLLLEFGNVLKVWCFFVFHCIASFWLVRCKQENAFQVPSSHRFLGGKEQ